MPPAANPPPPAPIRCRSAHPPPLPPPPPRLAKISPPPSPSSSHPAPPGERGPRVGARTRTGVAARVLVAAAQGHHVLGANAAFCRVRRESRVAPRLRVHTAYHRVVSRGPRRRLGSILSQKPRETRLELPWLTVHRSAALDQLLSDLTPVHALHLVACPRMLFAEEHQRRAGRVDTLADKSLTRQETQHPGIDDQPTNRQAFGEVL